MVSTLKSLSNGSGAAVDDLAAAHEHLRADERCTGKMGSVGFCMGGGFCLLLAPTGVSDATAPNYGLWPKDIDGLKHSCPVVASDGEKDRWLPSAATKLEELLTEGGVPQDVVEYPGVGHAFMND